MKLKRLVLGMMVVTSFTVAAMYAAGPATRPSTTQSSPSTQAAATTQPGVMLINMHFDKIEPQAAFDEMSKQSGVKFSTFGNLWQQENLQEEFEVDLKNRPFWSAVNELCDAFDVTVQGSNFQFENNGSRNARRLQLMPAQTGKKIKPPSFEKDGFLVQAMSFSRQQTVNYMLSDHATDYCSLQLMVFTDPSLHISNFNSNVKADEAVDDAGHSMLPDASNRVFSGNQQSSLIYNCYVALKYPENAGKKIAHLKCTLQMRGSDSVETMTVEKPLEADESSKEFGDTTVTFRSLKKMGIGRYELKVGINRDGSTGGDPNNLMQAADLLDASGKPFAHFGGGTGSPDENGESECTIMYGSNPGFAGRGGGANGEPAKWVLEMPKKSHAIKIPVEFKDLPLP